MSPKNPILSYFEGPPRVLAKKSGFWSFFGPKTTWSQIILGNIAELLAVLWSMNDVREAQKTCSSDAKTAFTMVLNAHISKYLFSQNGAVVWVTRVVPGILGVCLSMSEYV